jgi:D-alanyl-D-alanine carboxypeptidase/D-alanyl-D-alanine-endopeptidase (penicillin-binding protein 4)
VPSILSKLLLAGSLGVGSALAGSLPSTVQEALRKAHLPESALVAQVQEVNGGPPLLAWNEHQPANPASVFKLVTTCAALDVLGPAWTWRTPVYLSAAPHDGVLEGSVWIKGSGDPKLVIERVWLLLRQLQARGVREIRGDIVLDRSAWALPEQSPADFDGEASRPYNVRPDALLLNFKSISLTFTPELGAKRAWVAVEPMLAGVTADASVPLAPGPCGDWRTQLQADWSDPKRLRFEGAFTSACGEQTWPVAYAEPARYNARLIEQLWRDMGGKLGGTVKDGEVPAALRPAFELESPALSEVVRDINKYSNNVMAEQLFYSLASANRAPGKPVKAEDAKELLAHWLHGRLGDAAAAEVVIDGGSGLSREARVSASALALLLQQAWSSPFMPELMSSLPVSGLDGTLRRSSTAPGRAHLKTGSLRDVAAIAGYVLGSDGKRYVVVGILNHAQAGSGRSVLDALTQWVAQGASAAERASERVVDRP